MAARRPLKRGLAVEQTPEVDLPPKACWGCGAEMTQGRIAVLIGRELRIYTHEAACPVVTERLAAQDRERQAAAYTGLLDQRAGLPEAGAGATLETYGDVFMVDDDNWSAYELCGRFLRAARSQWPGRLPRGGFTLCGQFGCGKTELVKALARSLARSGVPVLWVNVPDELESLKGRFGRGGSSARLAELQETGVLVLDDLGRERASAWTVDQVLYPLIDARYRDLRPTICTTNETLDDLRGAYETLRGDGGERARSAAAVIDRLRERSPWVGLAGASRRKPSLEFLDGDPPPGKAEQLAALRREKARRMGLEP